MEPLTPDVIQSVVLGIIAAIYGGGKVQDFRASKNGSAPLTRAEHDSDCQNNLSPIHADIKEIRKDIRNINDNLIKIAGHHE